MLIITRPNCAMDRSTILCLNVPEFQRQVLRYVPNCKWIPQTKFQWIPQQLNLTIQMFYHLFVDSTNCSGFHKYCCGFPKFAYFWSDFEWYNDLGICLWNPKQHRRSKKSSNVADSATKLILACCGFRLQCRECTVWPRNDTFFGHLI